MRDKITFKKQNLVFVLLGIGFTVYVLKSVFVGADIDEAYGVTLGYRLVRGDRLFADMWEPHQTSAVFTAFLIRVILFCTGGSLNGLTVLLRIAFFVVHGAITVFLYRTLRGTAAWLGRSEALLCAAVYFITTPKCNYVPEYSNLHVWFSTLTAIFLLRAYFGERTDARRLWELALAGLSLSADVLAYPSMILFYPFCIFLIFWLGRGKERGRRLTEAALFTLPCIVSAGVFLCCVLAYMSPAELVDTLPYIMVDGSHQMSVRQKVSFWGKGIWEIFRMTAGCGAAAAIIVFVRRKREPSDKGGSGFFKLIFWWFVVQTVYQVQYWFHTDYNSGYPQLAYTVVPLLGLVCAAKSRKKPAEGVLLIALAGVNFFCLNLLSNWQPGALGVYLVTGLLGGLLCFRVYFEEQAGALGKRLFRVLCLAFLFSELFGRTLLMIGGEEEATTVFHVRGVSREGVRAGILTSYMNSYRYNKNAEQFEEIVGDARNVLYLGPSQYFYMLGDCVIASPSTISTPVFDESLKVYFDRHPERFPEVVVLESCYSDVSYFAGDDYIYTWIAEEFVPAQMEDFPYVRVYRR